VPPTRRLSQAVRPIRYSSFKQRTRGEAADARLLAGAASGRMGGVPPVSMRASVPPRFFIARSAGLQSLVAILRV